MLNMIESRVVEHTWRQWEPQIIYVQHQTSPFPTRIWLPPFAEPIATHAPYLMSRQVNTIGMAIAQGLEERGQVGATHMGTGYDAWYAGYVDYAPMFKNVAAFWTETALAGMASSREYKIDAFPRTTATCARRRSMPARGRQDVDAARRGRVHGNGIAVGARLRGAVQGKRPDEPLSIGQVADREASPRGAVRLLRAAGSARQGRPRSSCCGGSPSPASGSRN